MASGAWFRPPRPLLVAFLAFALAPVVALGWLGWRLLEQERALERQRAHESLQSAADRIGATLARQLTEIEGRLSSLAVTPDHQIGSAASELGGRLDDALIVVLSPEGIDGFPPGRLLYYPFLPSAPEPPAETFAQAEALEFRSRDPAGAAAAYRKLARSPEPAVRAAAALGAARSLRKAHRLEQALAAYGDLARLGATPVSGLPADLLARHERCALLDELNRLPDSRREAESLYSDLQAGRWRLRRAAYRFYAQEARRRLASNADANALDARAREQVALAGGVESLWETWQALGRGEGTPTGRQVLRVDDRSVLLLWRSAPERMVALVAGPRFLESEWLSSVAPAAAQELVSLSLTDAEGRLVAGRPAAGSRDQAVRTPADTGLPWTLQVVDRSPAPTRRELLARWRFLLLGFAVMGAVVLAGGYFTLRAMSRELAVARLKSDFVGAVSHEFRTPLTALCQLAETFAQGRVADEAQRRQYYDLLLRETRRLRRLVEGLLDFGRMEGGVREYRSELLDATELVRDTVADFQEEVARQGYRVELSGDEAPIWLRGDEEALRRTLWNLLDNAVKYSPGAFTIWVDLSRHGSDLHLRVWDQGLGIAEEEQAQVFRKFVRGASSRAAGVKGTGIGLSMVDHIVRGHRGSVTVESGTGLGSTFTVVLPLEE
jgi:signal transduction histidine kinase